MSQPEPGRKKKDDDDDVDGELIAEWGEARQRRAEEKLDARWAQWRADGR